MALPLSVQKFAFGNRNVVTPALVSSRRWVAGDIWLDGGQAVFYSGIRDAGASETVNVTYVGTFDCPCGSAVTAAIGADAYYDTVNRTVVTGAGANIILIGKFAVAKTNGQTRALVRLNNL
jgi:predicted RecA/RadA family phage recombinase